MSCDPLNEICPEQYGESTDAADHTHEEDTYLREVAPYTLLWGAGVAGMLAFSVWIEQEYPIAFEEENIVFPDRVYLGSGAVDRSRYDIDWALETPENVAWTKAYQWMQAIYGFGFAVWAANMGIDNAGGNLHEFFWRVTQVFQLAPLVQAYLAWKVITSYSFDYNLEKINETSQNTEKQNRSVMYRRYIVETGSGISPGGVFDEDQLAAQWGIMLSTVVIALIQNAAYPHIAQTFHEDRVEADLLAAQESAN